MPPIKNIKGRLYSGVAAYLKGCGKWISEPLQMILCTESPLCCWHKGNIFSLRGIPYTFSIYVCTASVGTDQQPSSLSWLIRFIFIFNTFFLIKAKTWSFLNSPLCSFLFPFCEFSAVGRRWTRAVSLTSLWLPGFISIFLVEKKKKKIGGCTIHFFTVVKIYSWNLD